MRTVVSMGATLLALTGCNLEYSVDASREQLASLYADQTPSPTPSGGFVDPGTTPTATFTPTITYTPTNTNTSPPVAAGVSIEVAPAPAGSLAITGSNGSFNISRFRCYRVSAFARQANGTEFPVSAATTFSVTTSAPLFANDTCTTAANPTLTVANGQSRASLFVKSTSTATTVSNTFTVTRTAGMMLGSSTATLNFVRDYFSLAVQPGVSGATTIPAGLCARINVNSLSGDGLDFVQPSAVQVRVRMSANQGVYTAADCADTSAITTTAESGLLAFNVTLAASSASTAFYVKTMGGMSTVTYNANAQPLISGFYAVVAGNLSLTMVRVITQVRWNLNAQPVIAGVCSGEAAQADASAHLVQAAQLQAFSADNVAMEPPVGQPIVATVTAPPGTSIYANAGCGTTTSTVSIANGVPGKIWVRAAAPGNSVVTATAPGLTGSAFTIVATNGPSASRFTVPFPTVAVTECSDPLEIQLVNSAGVATAANAAGGGNANLTIAGLPTGSKIYLESDTACLGQDIPSVTVAGPLASAKFRVKAALTAPPTSSAALAVTDGPLKTTSSANLALARKDLETDRACLNQAGDRAGLNSFEMISGNDEVARSILRFPSGKLLLAGESTSPPINELTPGVPHAALALVGADCRLVTNPTFFGTSTGYHLLMNSSLYPDVAESGSGFRKVIAVNETANSTTGATRFYAAGYAIRPDGTRDVLVARYLNDGTLDASFGDSTGILPAGSSEPIRRGYLIADLGLNDEAMDLAIVDNRLLVVSNSYNATEARVWMQLFNLSGVESGSRATIQFTGAKVSYGGLAIWSDGTNVFALVGGTSASVTPQGEQLYADWFVSKNRITVDGFAGQPSSPSVNFGSQTVGDDDRLSAIAVQTVTVAGAPRLGVVMAGSSMQGSDPVFQKDAAFARLKLPNLELDQNVGSQDPNEYFQSNGKKLLEAVRHQSVAAMTLDAASRVLGFGSDADNTGAYRPYVVRLMANGDANPVSTKVTNTFAFGGTRDGFEAAVRQPDNKNAVAGATGTPLHRHFLISILLE